MQHAQYKFANYFISKAKQASTSLTHMQIQKLVYYTHGYLLAKKDTSPIKSPFQAWDNGPVNPDLYSTLKVNKSLPIDSFIVDFTNSPINLNEEEYRNYQPILDDVWKKFGGMNAWALSNLTHAPGSPWSKVYEPGVKSISISETSIKEYFKQHVCSE